MTAETLTPEQRAHDVATFLNLPNDGIALRVITAAIRAAETEAVARCVEFVRGYNAWKRVPDTPDQPPTEIAEALKKFATPEAAHDR